MIINLTPHQINLVAADGAQTTIPPTAPAARVATRTTACPSADGWPVNLTEFGAVENLPAPQDGVIYVASLLVAQVARRADVVSPDTGPTAIRDNGQIVAVRGFVRQV